MRYLKPATMVGVDLSEEAVRFCRRTHALESLTFKTGDAENLPFAGNSFDAVINVESSHCYPNIAAFFNEVCRVLRPGGHFLYADFRNRNMVDSWRGTLQRSGLSVVAQTDITPNVVRALDAENDRKVALLDRVVPRILHRSVQDFAAVRGSQMYDAFFTRSLAYISFIAKKSAVTDRACKSEMLSEGPGPLSNDSILLGPAPPTSLSEPSTPRERVGSSQSVHVHNLFSSEPGRLHCPPNEAPTGNMWSHTY
jgi:SAM-dependent methyltransferase